MAETLSYNEIYYYDTMKKGITVPVYLKYGSQTVDLKAKIDTGAENCIFERKHGELLGIEVERGELQSFSAATSSFLAYGHELTINSFRNRICFNRLFCQRRIFHAQCSRQARLARPREIWAD